jgi:RNA polymerase sigma factor (sigma-70 family)
MRRLWLVSSKETTHEEVFLQRYDRLLSQALHITNRGHSAAEDLVHDAFIQFTLSKPDLSAINDLDSYLFIVLRNMHLSQVRRASQHRFAPISIADYDSAAIGLRALDIQNHLQAVDELLRICDYVCVRKESSKAASVLILRFFHGYFTSEIAEVIQAPRRTVHEWLRLARNEVKAYLEDPEAAKAPEINESEPVKRTRNEHDLLLVLRDRIFASRRGACLSVKQLEKLYAGDGPAIESKTLAHIVSCPRCLDEVNKNTGLPPFSERYPTDVLGTDTRSTSGGKEMNRVTRADHSNDYLKICRRRLGEVLDHQPQALSFSANGFILGSQKVSADTTEQILNINIDEELNFVEVFSEQGIRLMFMGVAPLSIGGVEQTSRLKLDEERELECAISFSQPWPTLHVTYRNLAPKVSSLAAVENIEDEPIAPVETKSTSPQPSLWSRLFNAQFWLRPEVITAILICCLALGLALWLTRPTRRVAPAPSAADLLARAVAKEDSTAGERGTITHRTINFEEANSTGAILEKKRIDVWQNFDRGILVRRLYNDRGELVAGDWRRADGVQTLYQHGVDPRIQLSPAKRDSLPLAFDEIWQLSTSAKEFARLIGNKNVRVEEGANTVKLLYEAGNENSNDQRVINASLTLARSDFHVVGQTLLVQQGNDLREFRFAETNLEKHASEKIPETIFEPDSTLLPEKKKEPPAKNDPEAVTSNEPPAAPVATAELEIEVLKILNQVEADNGEQIFVRRSAAGVLEVDGVVEDPNRKQEILKALASVSGNAAVRISIETVDERVAREKNARAASDAVSVERIEPTSNSIPLEPDLRAYFTARGVAPDRLDSEVQSFSRTALAHSSKVLQHAGALMSLTGRFSVDELKALDPAARTKWLGLLHAHAQGLRENVVALQRELGEALNQPRSDVLAEPSIENDAMLIQTVNRLFTTASAIDQTVRATLSLSNNPGSAAKIKTSQFWRSLATAEDLSSKVASSK